MKKRKQTQRQRKRIEQKVMSANTPPQSPAGSPHSNSQREEHNARKRRREIATCYRDNARLLSELDTQKRLNASLKKSLKEKERKSTVTNQRHQEQKLRTC